MHMEIERKFLVTGDFRSQVYNSTHIRQGYIASGNGKRCAYASATTRAT